jgi:hypothetical protein
MVNSFYISNGGDALGPYEMGQLRSMWNAGQIAANTLYWNEGGNEWRGISELRLGVVEEAPSASLQKATSPPLAGASLKERNPISYWASWIGGIGFGIGFLTGLSKSAGSIGLVGAIAFSVGFAIPMFLLFAAIGAIVGLVVKKRRK